MPDHYENFYRYEGSLTTPECNEIVIWTVFDKVNTISASQVSTFNAFVPESSRDRRPVVTAPDL